MASASSSEVRSSDASDSDSDKDVSDSEKDASDDEKDTSSDEKESSSADDSSGDEADKPEKSSSSDSSETEASSDTESKEESSKAESSSQSKPEAEESSSSQSRPEAEQSPAAAPASFHVPKELRAVTISAGTEYQSEGEGATAGSIAAQIDQAVANAVELTMNTVLLDPGKKQLSAGFDSLDYAITKAREKGLYVFVRYDVRRFAGDGGSVSAEGLSAAEKEAEAFAKAYVPDALLLDGYASPTEASSYEAYLSGGGGMGYENYLKQAPKSLLRTTAAAFRRAAPEVQVGLLAGAVWENSSVNPDGSETAAEYTDLSGGNADTRAMLQDGLFDCVMVKNFGSTAEQAANFDTVAAWWVKQAQSCGVTLYMLHAADKLGTQATGWGAYEQLTKQVINLEKMSGVSGSAFQSLKALMANPGSATTTLVRYMNDQINEQYVLTQLSVSKPDKLTFTTKEQTVTFQGASDPQEKVTLNDAPIETNDSGYFITQELLEPGVNKFVIAHKGKSVTYTITREVDVLKEIQPVGSMTVEGGTQIRVTALAYQGATVTASIGGQQIALTLSEDLQDEALRDTGYVMYAGTFTAPAASASAVNMGTISVTASAQGFNKTLQGASVMVNKIATVGGGGVIQVVSDQAETFPVGTLDDTSSPACYPLPKGTMDVTSGDSIVYNATVDGEAKRYQYWKLQSGTRVYANDIQSLDTAMPDNNTISKMSIKSSGQYTTVSLATQNKVPYTVSYDGSSISFAFKYTANVPESVTLNNNAIFASAQWNASTLVLQLRKSGGFVGYKAYYDGDTLVLRFNNPPGSLSGARIVVDPGHGGNDPGASGFYPGKDEADINLAIAQKLVAELQGRGASVLMTSPGSTMASRMAAAKAFNPQVLVSIHGNSSKANPTASGSEVYYFYPFAKQLAAGIAANASSSLGGNNRGAKSGLFYMTRESQFAAVLVETGFVTNEAEYTKLINSKYQSRLAQGIANAISGYLGGANSGGGTGGTDDEEEPSSSQEENTDGALRLSDTSLTLQKGETARLSATGQEDVEWASDDTAVAKVSTSGKVTATGAGTTYIWAYAGDEEARCKVTVSDGESSSDGGGAATLRIAGNQTIYPGDRSVYTVTVSPSGFSGVDWWIEDDSVATIVQYSDTECSVEGISSGSTYLCVEAKNDRNVVDRFPIRVSG